MIQFYSPDIYHTLALPESDSKHCVRVLRMKEGDMVEVTDGKGHRYTCRLMDANPKGAAVEIVDVENIALPWSQRITVAVAPTKHLDRMEWLVEKLTEIGINRFVPLLCRHSERRELKTERLEKIAVSAMKQSLKAVLPQIDGMTPFESFVAACTSEQRFICYCSDDVERRSLACEYRPGKDVTIIIGPEGDFSPSEVKSAMDNGFMPVTLGDTRLRTETAALVACATCHVIDGAASCITPIDNKGCGSE